MLVTVYITLRTYINQTNVGNIEPLTKTASITYVYGFVHMTNLVM